MANVYNGSAGGKGGIAGAGGAGEKVCSVEMNVTPGTDYAVQIGAGGEVRRIFRRTAAWRYVWRANKVRLAIL